jgi:hypothetical protein
LYVGRLVIELAQQTSMALVSALKMSYARRKNAL